MKTYELDELYWYINRKAKSETKENIYLMTMVSREVRQIVGYAIVTEKSSIHVQQMVDKAPSAMQYYSDGWAGYADVKYPGTYTMNIHDKSNTFTVESVNADIREYIPGLARKKRCFYRSIDTLKAVFKVFVHAYNQFGRSKYLHSRTHSPFVNFV
ncbi:hypothetical protein AGMMS49992_31930 [Clostridia bacterium]|nr:hypothetical protein AGMMS49992_31930 [Clostridia bacterium]